MTPRKEQQEPAAESDADVEDDQPRGRAGGTHEVEEFDRVREGRPEHVRAHTAKNPKR